MGGNWCRQFDCTKVAVFKSGAPYTCQVHNRVELRSRTLNQDGKKGQSGETISIL